MQVKLLRVLQEREFQRVGGQHDLKVDVRIVAATNQDLQSLVAERKFRQDLFYRLDVFPIHLPSLRERAEDIPLIADHILHRHAALQKKALNGFTREALEVLMRHRWPGNIRELENVIERAVTLAGAQATIIQVDLLPLSIREVQEAISAEGLGDLVNRVEWPLIVEGLKGDKGLTGLLQRHWGFHYGFGAAPTAGYAKQKPRWRPCSNPTDELASTQSLPRYFQQNLFLRASHPRRGTSTFAFPHS